MSEPGPENEAPNPHGESVRKLADAMLRTGLPTGLVTVAVAAVLATVLVGLPGLFGALVGGAIGLALSLLTIGSMRLTADFPPEVVMGVAMGGFVFKLVALLIAAVTLKNVDALHTYSLGLTLLASIFVWAGAEVFAFRRTPIPTIVP